MDKRIKINPKRKAIIFVTNANFIKDIEKRAEYLGLNKSNYIRFLIKKDLRE